MKILRKYFWPLTLIGLVVLMAAAGLTYRPPLLDRGRRNPVEFLYDFFVFSWYFSRQVWFEQGRNWKRAEAEKLLAAWHRPAYLRQWGRLRGKSWYALAGEYEMHSHRSQAARLLLQAHADDPGNRWLALRVASRLFRLQAWDELQAVSQEILRRWPRNEKAKIWLQEARERSGPA